jgi:hypothetical protein
MTFAGVPELPGFRKITMADKPMIDKVFGDHPTEMSERTFGLIYVWRGYEGRSELSQLEGHLVFSWFRANLGRMILVPVGPYAVSALEKMLEMGFFAGSEFRGVFGLLEPDVGALRTQGLAPVSVRDEWDYVYRVEDLAKLEGPGYHTQRKELGKARSAFIPSYEPMTREHQRECLELQDTWCDMKHCNLDRLSSAEDLALREGLEHMDELGFFGGVALVDGRIQALTLGERLNPNTAVVHFEKANPAMRGMYQFINKEFCVNALKGYEFVNREQDVGEPGLRRAKEGYHPHHFVEKHVLMVE